jgi:hypothetical protein
MTPRVVEVMMNTACLFVLVYPAVQLAALAVAGRETVYIVSDEDRALLVSGQRA